MGGDGIHLRPIFRAGGERLAKSRRRRFLWLGRLAFLGLRFGNGGLGRFRFFRRRAQGHVSQYDRKQNHGSKKCSFHVEYFLSVSFKLIIGEEKAREREPAQWPAVDPADDSRE